MYVKSRSALQRQKSLRGYIIYKREERQGFVLHWALQRYRRYRTSKKFNNAFDTLSGSTTVFTTKTEAARVLKTLKPEKQAEYKVTALAAVARLVPDVDSNFRLYYRAEPIYYNSNVLDRAQKMLKQATDWETSAKQNLRAALRMKRKALRLQKGA